ncbi:MAG: flavodoxin-dependent (E)-4-hydroxy-3-methylbut-2-enyl-diphosphate synthase [Candidatus Omnitrophica bacterium]|nr:flavodoxin-dependent (E)-4-hydroxy-3-methylbut-2-enyl-diphosphate synthase [Candidatus Omnitrophota bacterium]
MGKINSIDKKIARRETKVIKVGNILIGGKNPIVIQGMTKTYTKDVDSTLKQIEELKNLGAKIVRLAIKDREDARAIGRIKKYTDLALVADIHFDWQLAILAMEEGIDKIRLNPGNLYEKKKIKSIVEVAKAKKIPIRVGVNSGSLRSLKERRNKFVDISELMVKEAKSYIKILEDLKFFDIVISLKASDIFSTIKAYKKMAKICNYPFHIGLTATGTFTCGIVKSTLALGLLLCQGIGDTLRVSLTAPPQEEVKVAKFILEGLNLNRSSSVEIISCPTCGRCEVDLIKIVDILDNKLSTINYGLSASPLKLAVMGCVVNGPGEAKEADLGIAFGKRQGLLFKKGRPIKKVDYKDCINIILDEVNKF